jgi:hypothetical protein
MGDSSRVVRGIRMSSDSASRDGERDDACRNGVCRYPYLTWEGGPHLLIPCSCAGDWTGCPPDEDFLRLDWDYGRACAATDGVEFGQVAVGTDNALVFNTDLSSSWGVSKTGIRDLRIPGMGRLLSRRPFGSRTHDCRCFRLRRPAHELSASNVGSRSDVVRRHVSRSNCASSRIAHACGGIPGRGTQLSNGGRLGRLVSVDTP